MSDPRDQAAQRMIGQNLGRIANALEILVRLQAQAGFNGGLNTAKELTAAIAALTPKEDPR